MQTFVETMDVVGSINIRSVADRHVRSGKLLQLGARDKIFRKSDERRDGSVVPVDCVELGHIVDELLRLRERAERAGASGTAFMIVAAARQAEKERGDIGRAEQVFEDIVSREPAELPLRYDIDGG